MTCGFCGIQADSDLPSAILQNSEGYKKYDEVGWVLGERIPQIMQDLGDPQIRDLCYILFFFRS